MPTVRFTQNIQRHVACPEAAVEGDTVREALASYFETNADARGYVLDDQGALRKHMLVFVNGRTIADRDSLGDAVDPRAIIDVMQALSGG
ncbi:MAG: MoaD/ThiS family protein [Phycisphaerales bacterium]|nr:MoaD/ThiS family protein [Phycisphaerales bacterium]